MMKIVLILTSKDDVTVDFIVKELKDREIAYYRLNTEDMPDKISIDFNINNNDYRIIDNIKNVSISFLDVCSVYYRRPVLNSFSYMESINTQEKNFLKNEMAYVLEGIYKILKDKYWLNNVYDIRQAENKIHQLQIAKEIGFKIPLSLISNQSKSINSFRNYCDNNCIIKPIKSGNMEDSIAPKVIFTTKIHSEQFEDSDRIESFPIFIQNNIHKKYDLRCTVIGDEVYTAQIHSQIIKDSEIDWRRSQDILEHQKHELPYEIKRKCLELNKRLNLNFSAIDLILDQDENYIFLEINPNGQWAWIEKRLEFPLSKRIVDLLIEGGNYSVK